MIEEYKAFIYFHSANYQFYLFSLPLGALGQINKTRLTVYYINVFCAAGIFPMYVWSDQRWTSILETSDAYWITFINSPEYWKRGCFWGGVQILKARARFKSQKRGKSAAYWPNQNRQYWLAYVEKNPQNKGSAVYENLAYISSKIEAPFVKSVSVSTFVHR